MCLECAANLGIEIRGSLPDGYIMQEGTEKLKETIEKLGETSQKKEEEIKENRDILAHLNRLNNLEIE